MARNLSFRTLVFCTLALLLAGSTARADGLFYKLPADKAWVKFDLEFTIAGVAGTGSLVMRSVGQTIEDGDKCRWIEMALDMKLGDNGDHSVMTKVLLPEKNLQKGKVPLERLIRGWYKLGDETKQLTDITDPAVGALATFFCGPLMDAKTLEKQFTESKLGNLECEVVTGSLSQKIGETNLKVDFENRLNDKAPFGVVSSVLKFEGKQNDNSVVNGELRLKLVDTGTDAVSALPDHQ